MLTQTIFTDEASSSSDGQNTVNILLLTQLIHEFYDIMHFQWEFITALSQDQDAEELEWLLRLFTACDPYLESECQFAQGDYACYVTYLVDNSTWANDELRDETSSEDDYFELEDIDFTALDEDRGFHLGLPPGLYDVLFPRERPLNPQRRN